MFIKVVDREDLSLARHGALKSTQTTVKILRCKPWPQGAIAVAGVERGARSSPALLLFPSYLFILFGWFSAWKHSGGGSEDGCQCVEESNKCA